MIDFSLSLFQNARNNTLVCAHRGSSGANIPCNTLASFKAALEQGADIIELDVSKSRDGKFYVFHPGMESAHLLFPMLLSKLNSKSINRLRFVNQDNVPTLCKINTLEEVLTFLKGKCYINIDKFWIDIPGITEIIRKTGVEKQVIIKTDTKEKYLKQVLKYAPDLMFMPIVSEKDEITDSLCERGINCIGAEVLFKAENAEVCQREYIESMHRKGRIVWVNSIVYNYKAVLDAGHTDDISVTGEADRGWGWLIDRDFDIIQTDWCLMLKNYIKTRGNKD
ncbi:MAG: glycerophosphodiester phosphodiesterase family protein [Ruminococcaceae bacterium]|nr:glycerophosphodiester phosphodiesterase family protein [Oscillospiraceae bacterium]MBR3595653.1 glycerophosphodiester phosphodiesterase family protein [Clostridia bacterium]